VHTFGKQYVALPPTMSASLPAVEVHNLHYHFASSTSSALEGCDLVLERGARCLLIGANGAGKSTLIRMFNNLETPKSGDIIIESDTFGTIVGFENHGGRTYHPYGTLGRVTYGYGNNDNDRKEGIHYKNLLGSYLHGPILPKNHEITDYLLEKACERKGILFEPKKIDNTEEEAAKQVLIKRAKENKK